jgi:hypothetical protein
MPVTGKAAIRIVCLANSETCCELAKGGLDVIAFGQLDDSDSSVWVSGPCPLFSTCTSNKTLLSSTSNFTSSLTVFSLYSVLVAEMFRCDENWWMKVAR